MYGVVVEISEIKKRRTKKHMKKVFAKRKKKQKYCKNLTVK